MSDDNRRPRAREKFKAEGGSGVQLGEELQSSESESLSPAPHQAAANPALKRAAIGGGIGAGILAAIIAFVQMFTGGVQVKLPKSELQPGESTKLRVNIIPNQIRKARSKPRILMITNDPQHAKEVITINVE